MLSKPGWKTTEFWSTVTYDVAVVITTASGDLSGKWAAILTAVATVGYAVARGLAKTGGTGVVK